MSVYPNGGTPPTTSLALHGGDVIHRVSHSLAFTGISWLPIVVAGTLSLALGLALAAWAVLRKPFTFPWED